MCKIIEIIEINYYALRKIASEIAFNEEITNEDKGRLYNALKGCRLLLMILEEGSPELYQKCKRDYDACIEEIKGRFNPSEYGFTSGLKQFFEG